MNVSRRKKNFDTKSNDKLTDNLYHKQSSIRKINKSSQKFYQYILITSFVVCALLLTFYFVLKRDDNLTRFSDLNSELFNLSSNDERKWGTFRSGHYFGLKTLAKKSLVFGLMWFENRIIENSVRIRHWCDQSDNLYKYGWLKHDFHSYGVQEIIDNDLNITTSFIISNNITDRSRWRARFAIDFNDKIKKQIKLQSRRANSTQIKISKEISLIPYFGLDDLNDNEELFVDRDESWLSDELVSFQFQGKTKVFNHGFKARIIVNEKDLIFSRSLNYTIDPPLLNVKESVMENLFITRYPGETTNDKYLIVLDENSKKSKKETKQNNLALKQLIVKVPSKIDFQFEELGDSSPLEDYSTLLKEKEQNFNSDFEKKFKLKTKGYSDEQVQFAQAALSNMIGSVGSFEGFSQVSLVEDKISKKNVEIFKYGPLRLVTSVPSRSFFPRGFLWDEGFHQLLISKFDRNLSRIILANWFSLMNRNGWIPREVILGAEAEERVPNEFIVQNIHVANPPTFFLLIDSILNNVDKQNEAVEKKYFTELFDKLVVWYDWFNKTQIGNRFGSYRWRGRNPTIKTELNIKTLSSGLDDYPRASSPTTDELHLDLFSWMVYATRTMDKLSKYLEHSTYQRFNAYSSLLTNEHLDKLHWSEEYQMYCDFGLHSKKVVLKPTKQSNGEFISLRKELEQAKYGCVNEFGYVSLFPFMLQLIEPTNRRLGVLLDKIRDPNLLWSNNGLRSLSINSSYYNVKNTQHDPPYWRGAVWINMNYLTLRSLIFYSKQDGPYKEKARSIYVELKSNLLNNVFNQYKNRNYFFENYDDQTGQGKGCYPFTGWTALIVLIMSDNYN